MLTVHQLFEEDWAKTKNYLIIKYIPNWEDPHWGENSELYLASLVSQFSFLISDHQLAENAFVLSKQMGENALNGISNTWDAGDELCPIFPRWWPHQNFEKPDPAPWKEIASAEQVEIAYLFTKLSGLTFSAEFNKALKSIATQIVQNVTRTIADDFEQCGTPPRPKPKGIGTISENFD